ncbi:hypothetical protein OWM07_02120 [Deferribacter thermophilus]|uniref:hypothetical protein n=1 Tax=Deferribacter thermophilus TaxID=53573 RepID=UPI003C19F76E
MDQHEKAEILKKKYFYKELILKKKIKLKSLEAAKKIVGVDTAYHLYQQLDNEESSK